MDKLTIGIFLEHYVDIQAGGAFSYSEALIEAVDQYHFDNALDIRFITTGGMSSAVSNNKILTIDPYRHINKKIRYRQHFNYSIIQPAKKLAKPLLNLHQKFQARFDTAYTKAIEEELARNEIDLVYYLSPQNHKLNYPFVSTHWDIGHRSMFPFPEVAMNGTFADRCHYYQTTLENAFAIYCESEAGRAELIKYTSINKDRVFVVPMFPGTVANLSVDLSRQVQCLEKYVLRGRGYFFYPAQFWPHKNHYNLLKAFKQLNRNYPEIKMLFTGADKGNLEYIKTVVNALGLQNVVVMPGFVSAEEIYSFYKNALALVMPTFLGPTNMPLLEAEFLGCPVICSNLEGHREMLGDNACYVEPADPQSIFDAMVKHVEAEPKKPRNNAVFNIGNAVRQIEANFLKLRPMRKTFGTNFNQFVHILLVYNINHLCNI
jgi:glycosyltransferase involved in cell wall biosynthesis